jgi:type VI secretion system Hcp family effector
MAVDAIITFESVTGGSAPAAFAIKDFAFGAESSTTIGTATGGAAVGKVKFNEFTIKKTTDQSSPVFFKNCCLGAHYKTVSVSMRQVGPDGVSKEFLRFRFETVFTTRIDWAGPGDEGPEESITFVYGKLGIRFTPEGGLKPVASGWDQVTNKAADDFAIMQ